MSNRRLETSREISKRISSGEKKPEHLGKKSGAVLQQELFSLLNTKEGFRDKTWFTKYNDVRAQCEKLGIWSSFITKFDKQFDFPRGNH